MGKHFHDHNRVFSAIAPGMALPPNSGQFEIQTLIEPVLVLNSPEDIRALANAAQYNIAKGNAVLRPFLGEHSLLLDGEEHASERRKVTSHFTRARIHSHGPLMEKINKKGSRVHPGASSIIGP